MQGSRFMNRDVGLAGTLQAHESEDLLYMDIIVNTATSKCLCTACYY